MDKKMLRVYAFFFVGFIIIFPLYTGKSFHLPTGGTTSIDNVTYAMQKKCVPTTEDKTTIDTNKATAVIVLDDGWQSDYTIAYPILKKFGYKASVAVIPSMVGKTNYLSLTQLQTLDSKDDWDLLNHTQDHVRLSNLSKPDQTNEIMNASKWLDANCFSRGSKILVYPYGSFNNTTISVLRENSFLSARSELETGVTKKSYSKYDVPVQIQSDTVDFKAAKNFVDNAIASKGTAIFVFHRFSVKSDHPKDTMFTSEQRLEKLLQYLAFNKDKIEVLTYTEWLQKVK